MLYVSLALVISGVVLVLFSLFFESEVSASRPPSDRYVPPMDVVETKKNNEDTDLNGISEELDFEIDDFTMLEEGDLAGVDEDVSKERSVDDNELSADKTSDEQVYDIVLYEDPERISVENTIDNITIKTEDVSRFSRVGEGTIQVLKDGINIRIGKRLYHFDFNKIDLVFAGKSHFVLTIKGSDVARVVMFEKYRLLPESIIEKLNNIINDGL
jgi:hypothetical protein